MGFCPQCRNHDALTEAGAAPAVRSSGPVQVVAATDIRSIVNDRSSVGIEEFDRVLGGGDHGIDFGDGLASFLQDVHAPADDRELDVSFGRLDSCLAGKAEVPGQVLLGIGASAELGAALADLYGTLATSARAAFSGISKRVSSQYCPSS